MLFMKANEVETLLSISKQTMLFYEKEGLIAPIRMENGYRNYQDKDIQTLRLIILFRELEIPIDDVRTILNGKLSFNECLTTRGVNIESKIASLEAVHTMVQYFKEKQLPIIPAIASIDAKIYPFNFGFQKTNKTISLGRRMTKNHAIKTLCKMIVSSLIASLCLFVGIKKIVGDISFVAVTSLSFLSFFLFLLVGTKQYTTRGGTEQYIEFLEDGVRFFETDNIFANLNYFLDVVFNDGKKYLKFYDYQNIEKVQIIVHKKYISNYLSYAPIPQQIITRDFYFDFDDNKSLLLINPIILENDGFLVAKILKEKVKNLVDSNNYLDELIRLDSTVNT